MKEYFIIIIILFSPWRIVDDCGGAFALGAIGGTLFHSIKGFRHAPSVLIVFVILRKEISVLIFKGQYRRLIGSLNAVKQRAPRVGGNFEMNKEKK